MLWLAASTARVSQSISVPVEQGPNPGTADIPGGAGLLGSPRGLGTEVLRGQVKNGAG